MSRITVIAAALLLAVCGFCLSGCGVDDIDISGYADEKIELAGLTDKDAIQTVTIEELKAMECKTLKTESTSDKIGVVKATGVELGTLLEKYGVSKDDVKKVTFYGADGYDVPLLADYIQAHDIYLAFGIDGEPLEADSIPCRLIIPKSDSAYWIRMITKIEFKM